MQIRAAVPMSPTVCRVICITHLQQSRSTTVIVMEHVKLTTYSENTYVLSNVTKGLSSSSSPPPPQGWNFKVFCCKFVSVDVGHVSYNNSI